MIRNLLFLFLLLLFPIGAHSQDPVILPRVGSGGISGVYYDVAVLNDDIAYFSNGFGIVVMDISDPANPAPIRIIPTLGNSQGLELRDGLIYLCDGYKGLRIFDTTNDPENPEQIGHLMGSENATDLDIQGDLAVVWQYRANYNYFIDISNPREPDTINTVRWGDMAVTRLFGDFAYVGQTRNELEFWDISDPINPDLIRTFDDIRLTGAEGLRLYTGDSLLMVDKRIFDVTDPEQPVAQDTISELSFWGCVLQDGIIYGSALIEGQFNQYGVAIYDISDPRQSERISAIRFLTRFNVTNESLGMSEHLAIGGGYVYAVNNNFGMTVLDCRDVRNPAQAGFYDNRANFDELDANENYLYVQDDLWWELESSYRLHVYSLEDPAHPVEVGVMENDEWGRNNRRPTRPTVVGDRLYTRVNGGIGIFSLENPEEPDPILRHYINDNDGYVNDFVIDGNVIYTASRCIRVMDFSDINNPQQLSIVHHQNPPYGDRSGEGLAIDEHHLYVCDTYAGLRIYNRDNPRQLELLSVLPWYNNFGSYHDVVLLGDNIAIVQALTGFWIVDINDRSAPQIITGAYFSTNITSLRVQDGVLFATIGYKGIYAIGLENFFGRVSVLGLADTPGYSNQFRIIGDYAYIADKHEVGAYDASEIAYRYVLPKKVILDYGRVLVGTESEMELVLANSSSEPQMVRGLQIQGEGISCDFNAVVEIEGNSRASFIVRFQPNGAGDVNGTLTFECDGYSPVVWVRGVGIGEGIGIPLRRGWQMISSPFVPDTASLPVVLRDIWDNLALIKNGAGQFTIPRVFNGIADWDCYSGYLVNMNADDVIQIEGSEMPPWEPIPLVAGWNLIPYFPSDTLAARDAFESLGDNLLLAKDGQGRFYLRSQGFSNMGGLFRGSGYQVKVTDVDTLIWQSQQERMVMTDIPSPTQRADEFVQVFPMKNRTKTNSAIVATPRQTKHFIPPLPTGANMSVLIADCGFGIAESGEIGVFTKDGLCVGSATFRNLQSKIPIGLAVWGDDPTTPEIDGAVEGEALGFRLWALGEEKEVEVRWTEGEGVYTTDGFAMGTIAGEQAGTPVLPTINALHGAFPNPFNGAATIKFGLSSLAPTRIAVYSLDGRLIEELMNGVLEAGEHSVVWNAEDFSSGIYLVKMETPGFNEIRKVTLIR